MFIDSSNLFDYLVETDQLDAFLQYKKDEEDMLNQYEEDVIEE